MADRKLPALVLGGTNAGGDGAVHDPLLHPELYEGVALRRMFAFFLDMLLVGVVVVLTFIPFGILAGIIALPVGVLVAVVYDVLTIGGFASATPGMRLFRLKVVNWSGGRPDNLQALLMSALFWTIHAVTGWLAAFVVLLNPRWRAAHDFLAGTVVVRSDRWREIN